MVLRPHAAVVAHLDQADVVRAGEKLVLVLQLLGDPVDGGLDAEELAALDAGRPRAASKAFAYLNAIEHNGGEGRFIAVQLLRLRLSGHIAIVLHTANSLVFLGLVGTVIGFIVALSGVDPAHAGEVDSVAPMVSTLVKGMSIALYTTLIGALLHIWLLVNYRMLAGGTARLFDAIVEFGERRVDA